MLPFPPPAYNYTIPSVYQQVFYSSLRCLHAHPCSEMRFFKDLRILLTHIPKKRHSGEVNPTPRSAKSLFKKKSSIISMSSITVSKQEIDIKGEGCFIPPPPTSSFSLQDARLSWSSSSSDTWMSQKDCKRKGETMAHVSPVKEPAAPLRLSNQCTLCTYHHHSMGKSITSFIPPSMFPCLFQGSPNILARCPHKVPGMVMRTAKININCK